MTPTSIFRSDLLADQVIIVTGGGSGLGLAIAQECAALGARVAITGRKADRLDAAAEELKATGAEVFHAPLDIRDEDAVGQWVEAVVERFGRVDVLVNNAGGQFPSPAIAIRPKGWRAVIDTNLNGTWWMSQVVGRQMMAQGKGEGAQKGGRIINIVANMWRGFPGMAHTGAARAGVVNLTKTLALEWAREGILVNAVAPGVIRTTGLDTYPAAVRDSIETEVPKHIPLKRLGEERDVVWAVVYLAGPGGDYITGETICVDGGQAHWGMVFPI
ncbi:MAG: SDR family oxidoreductase [Myxococcales bacterium]|nr:SDR family oxidoreductase [Myxococcales bacterium]